MLLAIETSSRVGSLALCNGTSILAERTFSHGLQNAAKVLPLIDELCRERGVTARGIQEIAVSIGPGSFTGLRIGVTLAKTLAFATGARLFAVPTLPAIASNAPGDAAHVLPILDAKRDQVFAAIYRRTGHALDEIEPPQLIHLPDLLSRAPRPLYVLGEGVPHHRQHLLNRQSSISDPQSESQISDLRPGITLAPEDLWYPKAATIAHLAAHLREQEAYADPFKLTPLYIRKPEAQERMEAGLLKHLES